MARVTVETAACSGSLWRWEFPRMFGTLVGRGMRATAVGLGLVLATACQDKPVPPAESVWLHSAQPNAQTVIVFVHGVLGDSKGTWAATGVDGGWPGLVQRDAGFGATDTLAVGYLSKPLSRASSIEEIAVRTLGALKDDGVFQRYQNVVFVAHSMGGLVTKRMLRLLRDESDKSFARVKAVVFFATPAKGSDLAGLADWMSSNPQFRDMSPSDLGSYLQALENDWMSLLRARANDLPYPRSFCAYEKLPAIGSTVVVPRSLAEQGCDQTPVAFDRDHFSIVKPVGVEDEVHKYLRARVGEALDPKAAPQKVTVRLVKPGGGLIREGDFLRSGEHYAIEVSASRAAWFYVFGADSSDRLQRLFPSESTGGQSGAVERIRVPQGSEEFFKLDRQRGVERIYLHASDTQVASLLTKGVVVAKDVSRPIVSNEQEVFDYLGVEKVVAVGPDKTGSAAIPADVKAATMLLVFEHR